ncbi:MULTISPECIES: hypothetical protein [unclassified Phormidesmis]
MTSQPDSPIGIQYQLGQLATATTELADRINDLREVVTTGFTELKESFTELKESFTELKEITQQQADTARIQAESIRSQTESINRFLTLLERDRT